jgi:hypothetical protein
MLPELIHRTGQTLGSLFFVFWLVHPFLFATTACIERLSFNHTSGISCLQTRSAFFPVSLSIAWAFSPLVFGLHGVQHRAPSRAAWGFSMCLSRLPVWHVPFLFLFFPYVFVPSYTRLVLSASSVLPWMSSCSLERAMVLLLCPPPAGLLLLLLDNFVSCFFFVPENRIWLLLLQLIYHGTRSFRVTRSSNALKSSSRVSHYAFQTFGFVKPSSFPCRQLPLYKATFACTPPTFPPRAWCRKFRSQNRFAFLFAA